MNCGMECIKYILFVVNFFFALGGLAVLGVGVLIRTQNTEKISDVLDVDLAVSYPSTVLIVVGAIIFIIAFFGCCGAIRESECMIITFAVIIMTLLVIQIAIVVYAFHTMKGEELERNIKEKIQRCVDNYYNKQEFQQTTDTFQALAKCCGANSYTDYARKGQRIPYSCCEGRNENQECGSTDSKLFKEGCLNAVPDLLHNMADMLSRTALAIGGVQLVGIIFALCLANSIRHADRRGYKV